MFRLKSKQALKTFEYNIKLKKTTTLTLVSFLITTAMSQSKSPVENVEVKPEINKKCNRNSSLNKIYNSRS